MRGYIRATVLALVFMVLFFNKDFVLAEISEGEVYYSKSSGPIGLRNQMPLYLFYLQMIPDKAEVIARDKFNINADYNVSNITVSAFTPATSLYDIQIDLEVSRVTLDFRYGLYDNLEIGLEVPYLSLSKGYLDDLIESFEDGIGARTPRSRERQGSYNFEYSFRYNNKYLIQKKHSTEGLGDVVLNAKYQLIKEQGYFIPNVSFRSAVKFPTADKDRLLGSGEFDYGIGLVADKTLFKRFVVYAGANLVLIDKPSFFSELGIDDQIYSGLLALEYFFTKRFSLITQVTGNSTPYPYSSTNPLDNHSYDFGIGANYMWKEKSDVSSYFAISENISAASSPDVSLATGLKWKF